MTGFFEIFEYVNHKIKYINLFSSKNSNVISWYNKIIY